MKQFFIAFFANVAALLFFVGGPILLGAILVIASVSSSASGGHSVRIKRNSILVFDMSMNVADAPEHTDNANPLASSLGGSDARSMTLRSLVNALKKAALDERITGVFLEGSFEPSDYGTGYASLKELREAIVAFENTKDHKKVYAYLDNPTTRDYYVASAATTVYLNPFGEMDVPGLSVIKTYLKGMLDKFGVDVQVTRVGKYKSAVEPFLLDKMSPEDREETQTLIDGLWGDFITAITESRKIDRDAFQHLVDTDGYITADHAKTAGLVDKLAYFGDVLDELGKVAPSADNDKIPFEQVSIDDYIRSSRTPRLPGERDSGNVVAVLYLEGEIVDGYGDPKSNIGGDRFAAEVRKLARNDDVKAVVLRINSPGGSAFASETILHEIVALKAKKPVIVSMGNYAASGGYWISTCNDRIFAEPNTITGSIGVFGLFFDAQKLFNNVGITFDSAKTGAFADFATISRPKTQQELDLAQARVSELYDKFLKKVETSRNLSDEALRPNAEGRVWSGTEALNLKLVDQIGGLNDAIEYAAKQAGLDSYKVNEFPKQQSLEDTLALLFGRQEAPVSKADPLTTEYFKFKGELKQLQEFNDPMGMYARMPFGWEIK